jgi:acetyltransferase-like isoleucine patch superfamily enzyme
MNKNDEAKQIGGFRRVVGKFLIVFTKWTLVPGKYRAKIQKLRGVHFDDVNSVFFGENVTIDGIYPNNVSIGKRCIITAGTKILTHFLDTEQLSDNPDFYFRFYQGKVRIEEDVFIGYNAVIAKPITIGKGSIIGANAVITKDVEPYSVMAGIPAKCIRKLDPSELK